MTNLKRWSPGDELSYGWCNKVADWINGLKVTGSNGIAVRQIDNQIHITYTAQPITTVWLKTADDGTGYPDPLSQPNTYYAEICQALPLATISGFTTFTPQTTGEFVYVYNYGSGFIPQNSIVEGLQIGGQYVCGVWIGDLAFGTTSGGPGMISMNVTQFDGNTVSGTQTILSRVAALPANQSVYALNRVLVNQGNRFNYSPTGCS